MIGRKGGLYMDAGIVSRLLAHGIELAVLLGMTLLCGWAAAVFFA